MHKLLSAAATWSDTLPARMRSCRLPFLSALFAGLLAHGFAFANKLLNADDLHRRMSSALSTERA